MNMGYIAPITPFDYIQYANRTVAATKRKREIQAVSLVKAVPFHLNEANEWESYVMHSGLNGQKEIDILKR